MAERFNQMALVGTRHRVKLDDCIRCTSYRILFILPRHSEGLSGVFYKAFECCLSRWYHIVTST